MVAMHSKTVVEEIVGSNTDALAVSRDVKYELNMSDEVDALFDYNPDHLLDCLQKHFNVHNDASLCRALHTPPSVISKVRHRRLAVSAGLLVRMHETTGIAVCDLRFLLGDRRRFFAAANLHSHG